MVTGATGVELLDPNGRLVSLNPTTQRYDSEIDDVLAIHGWRDDDEEEEPAMGESKQDLLVLPDAMDGDYLLRVVGDSDGDVAITVNATTSEGVAGGAAVLDTVVADAGIVYRLAYSREGSIVQLERLAITATDGSVARQPGIRVVQNPTVGLVRFEIARLDATGPLEIFDIIGRRVASIPFGSKGDELGTVFWDARGSGRGAGVYFARLGGAVDLRVVRFVVLP